MSVPLWGSAPPQHPVPRTGCTLVVYKRYFIAVLLPGHSQGQARITRAPAALALLFWLRMKTACGPARNCESSDLRAHAGLGTTSSREPVPSAFPHWQPRGRRCLRAACSRHAEPTGHTFCGEGSCGRTPSPGQHWTIGRKIILKGKASLYIGLCEQQQPRAGGEQDGKCGAGACSRAECVRAKRG